MDNKQIFLHDLCTRLPYGIRCFIKDDYAESRDGTLYEIDMSDFSCGFEDTGFGYGYWYTNVVNVKPYLRPMSSMTEEEKEEYCQLQAKFLLSAQYPVTDAYEIFDWLNRKMFDYRGLIPQGLALAAPEDLYQL